MLPLLRRQYRSRRLFHTLQQCDTTSPWIARTIPLASMATDASRKNLAAWLKEAKGPIEIGPSEIPEPGEGEILIRVR